MKIVKNIFIGASVGITTGFLFSLAFNLLYKNTQYYPSSVNWVEKNFGGNVVQATLISVLLWAIVGITFALTSYFFRNQKLGLLKATLLHFLVNYIVMGAVAFGGGWFPVKAMNVLSFTLQFAFIYLICWFSKNTYYKKTLEAVNEKISS